MATVKVAVRVRPFNRREINMGSKCIIEMDSNKTKIFHKANNGKTSGSFKEFVFDYSYWSFEEDVSNYIAQEKVFQDLGTGVVDSAFEGYNACVFAYGQTGSGKTYTMMGTPDNQGLIPRICESLFNRMLSGSSYRVEVSYLEIYNEKVKDLLSADTGHNLRVREHPRLGPTVQDLSKHLVSEYSHIQALMSQGNSHRTTANTNMNDSSSRSHAIFTIMFVQAGISNNLPTETVSKIHLVDLAGSERADATGATGQRLKEGAHINKSLVTLGSVISALAELSSVQEGGITHRNAFIPYRDSVLTWLLKDSLGGNSKTIMIAAVSPADCNYSETLSTLRYANRAKNIINKPTINEDPNVKLIRELRAEIGRLKGLITPEYPESHNQVLATLYKKEAEEKVLTERWAEKWKETQVILQEQEALALRKAGTGVVLDSERPHLICIDDNLLSTGVTLYHLKDGETLIGTEAASQKQHIVLTGIEMEPEHCSILLQDEKATLVPKPNAHCWVNGFLADKPTELFQGCIILVGRTNMFRYNDPVQAEKMRKEGDISRSHLNLSRMSLMTWSSSDLMQSADLNATCEIVPDKEDKRNGEICDGDNLQDYQIGSIGTLECAQKQLEKERIKMESLYKSQAEQLQAEWKRLERHKAESIAALSNKEAKLYKHWQLVQNEISDEINQLKEERVKLESLRENMQTKNVEFAHYITKKIDILTQNNNCNKFDTSPLSDFALNHYRELIDKLSSGIISVEFLTQKIESKCDSSIKNVIMDDIRNHQQNILAPIDRELKIKAEEVLEREIKVKELESELTSIMPLSCINESSKGVSQHVIQTTENNKLIECRKRSVHEDSMQPCSSVDTSNSVTELNMDTSKLDYELGSPETYVKKKSNTGEDTLHKNAFLLKDLLKQITNLRINILHGLESGANQNDTDEKIALLQEMKRKFTDIQVCFENDQEGSNDNLLLYKDQNTAHMIDVDPFNVNLMSSNLNSTNHCNEFPLPTNYSLTHPLASSTYSYINQEETRGLYVQVPSFVLRGTGASTHYVYEVALWAGSDNWTILRRYSRFRELHLTMKEKYGTVVSSLVFPPRKLFFRLSEDIAKERRPLLETYLQSLIHVCSQIKTCPLYSDNKAHSKQALVEFSPFFRRGIFETGKYATS